MPPRIRSTAVLLLHDAATSLSHTTTSFSSASSSAALASASVVAIRSFSSTPTLSKTNEARFRMLQWYRNGPGTKFRRPTAPTYLGPLDDQPFPLNPLFRSQSVLAEDVKELIWKKVIGKGEAIKAVSAEMGIDVRRVAAVVRMKEVEKQWVAEDKSLATPYAEAVMRLLPQTQYIERSPKNTPHEPINELFVHRHTMNQLFLPVSESRHFTREDAAKAFHDRMLSADARSPQKELIDMEQAIKNGEVGRAEGMAKFRERAAELEDEVAERIRKRQDWEERSTRGVKTDRFEFRFRDMKVEDVGRNGRSRKGVGWRYGAPFNDRKRGQVKIPTSVP